MLERLKARRANGEGGFTLIELLIVIIILAILAGIVVFAVGGTSKNAAVAACNSDAKSVETAVEAYDAQMNAFPTMSQLVESTTDANGNPVGPWLRSTPGTAYYVITIDSTGGVWVDGNNYDTATPNPCNAAS